MYHDDHGLPHFHVMYAGFRASIAIESLDTLDGHLPRRQLALARQWAALHKQELFQEWELARNDEPLFPIAPLT
jgi:hypothetical protein